MFSRIKKIAFGGFIGTLVITGVSIFGTEIFSSWWNSEKNAASARNQQTQLEALRQQTEVMANLRDAIASMNDERAQAPSDRTARSEEQGTPPSMPGTTQAESAADNADTSREVPAPVHEASETAPADIPVPAAPSPLAEPPLEVAAAQPEPVPSESGGASPSGQAAAAGPSAKLSQSGNIIGVFEDERFSMCGREGFQARVASEGEKEQIVLSSRDRTIPGAGFRGFEATVAIEQAVEIWAGCLIATAIESAPGGRRILISTGEHQ